MNNSHLHFKQLARQIQKSNQAGGAIPIFDHSQDEIHIFISDELAGRLVDHLCVEIIYSLNNRPVCSHLYQKLAHLTT